MQTRFVVVALFLALGLLITTPVHAAPQSGEVHGDWKTACDQDGVCHIFQRVKPENTDKELLNMAVGFPGGGEKAYAIFTLPLGVALKYGVEFRVDREPTSLLPFAYCKRDGCRAELALSAAMLKSLKRGRQALVRFVPLGAQAVELKVSLIGFTTGIESLAN